MVNFPKLKLVLQVLLLLVQLLMMSQGLRSRKQSWKSGPEGGSLAVMDVKITGVWRKLKPGGTEQGSSLTGAGPVRRGLWEGMVRSGKRNK